MRLRSFDNEQSEQTPDGKYTEQAHAQNDERIASPMLAFCCCHAAESRMLAVNVIEIFRAIDALSGANVDERLRCTRISHRHVEYSHDGSMCGVQRTYGCADGVLPIELT